MKIEEKIHKSILTDNEIIGLIALKQKAISSFIPKYVMTPSGEINMVFDDSEKAIITKIDEMIKFRTEQIINFFK